MPVSARHNAWRDYPFTIPEEEWRARMSKMQYAVMRAFETERPGSSPLNKEARRGMYMCAGCGQTLFNSRDKFDSGTGWPSFCQPVDLEAVDTQVDSGYGMVRTEVHCSNCGGHLGHVFEDGPEPTGLRYCMNGIALTFQPD